MCGSEEFQSHIQGSKKVPWKYSGTDEDLELVIGRV